MLNIQINEFSQSECTHAANLQARKQNAANSPEPSSQTALLTLNAIDSFCLFLGFIYGESCRMVFLCLASSAGQDDEIHPGRYG